MLTSEWGQASVGYISIPKNTISLTSPYGGGRPGRVKRKRVAVAAKREGRM